MGDYAIYLIDDSVEAETPAEDLTEVETAETEADDESDDADYVPRTVAAPKRRRQIGTVQLDPAGMLSVLSAEPDDEQQLGAAVKHVNERGTLFLKRSADDDEDPFAIAKIPVTRGEPLFFEALQNNLQRWHGMELEAAPG